ncbi:ELO family, conserved site,ELO family [Cinara cedri]|uniref:Elongation of very long chain fatty acids protein n=1 Tax=Cinara cedri TaxID=506608 RepID=A0A5E4M7P2_9HEMI|nr:ELO family, conserved site,ELO family [Cinara cedri]
MMDASHNMNDTQYEFSQFLTRELKSGSAIDSWLFVSSPWPICTILAAYLTFVFEIGPRLMKKREPINIKYIMLVYNLMQIVFNSTVLIYLLATPGVPNYIWNHSCHPDRSGAKNHIIYQFHSSSWYFSVSKIIDLLDTVFFVLRKKQSHISFLHVYHHVNMVITCFLHLRFIKSENAVYGTIVNSFVHVVMYSYYFLTVLGPNMQKYLWWKKYLTRIQIVQFLFGISYCVSLFAFNCTFPKSFIAYILADVAVFLFLFVKFYKKTYKRREKI